MELSQKASSAKMLINGNFLGELGIFLGYLDEVKRNSTPRANEQIFDEFYLSQTQLANQPIFR
jgi:hypothetical protein